MGLEELMTLQKTKLIARHLGLTLRQLRSGNYRVNFRYENETTAYYTTVSKKPSTPRAPSTTPSIGVSVPRKRVRLLT